MATRRPKVDDPLSVTPQLRPVATPVDQYVRPNSRRPQMHNRFAELAELSPTIMKIVDTLGEEERERRKKAGAAAFEDLEKRRMVQEKGFGELVRKGEIREAESPFFQIGFFESSARTMATKYRTAVQSRMQELTQVSTPDGEIVAPGNLDAVLAEEWGRIAEGNGATLGNHYGNQEAQALRAQINLEAQGVYAEGVAKNTEAAHRLQKDREITDMMIGMMANPDRAAGRKLVEDFIDTEIWQRFEDPVAKVVDVVLATSDVIAAEQDVEDALAFLDEADRIQLGSATVSKVRSELRSKLANQRQSLEQQAERERDQKARDRPFEVNEYVEDQRNSYLPELIAAKQAGGLQALRATYQSLLGEMMAEEHVTSRGQFNAKAKLLEDLQDTYESLAAPDPIETDAAIGAIREAMRDPNADVLGMIKSAAGVTITHATAEALRAEARERLSLMPYTFGNAAYQDHRAKLRQGYNPSDFSPTGRRELAEKTNEIDLAFQEAYEAKLESVQAELGTDDKSGIERAMNDWIQTDGQSFLQRRNELVRDLEQGLQKSRDEILTGIRNGKDMSNEIDTAFKRGEITATQKQELLGEQYRTRNEIQNTEDFVETLTTELGVRLEDAAEIDPVSGRAVVSPADRQNLENMRRDIQTKAREKYLELLEGRTPREFQQAWDAAKEELRYEYLQKVESDDQRLARRLSEANPDAEDLDQRVATTLDRRQLADSVVVYEDWENVTASSPVIRQGAEGVVESDFYEDVADAYRDIHGHIGFWDKTRDRPMAVVNQKLIDDYDTIVAMSSEDRVAYLEAVALNGALSMDTVVTDVLKVGGDPNQLVSFKGVKVDPYFTPIGFSQYELKRFLTQDYREAGLRLDREEMKSFFKRIDIPWDSERYPKPMDDPEVQVFWQYQLSAWERITPGR